VSLQQIDAKMLSKMFLAGAKNLENKKEWINELNVFPVPDGDTGTNMTMTIMSAAREVSALGDSSDMEAICKAISSGSLRGARGNSGVILSQLFRGFTKIVKTYSVLDAAAIAEAFGKAVETAYKAVMKPKEGTILTVAKGAADKANELLEEGTTDLETFLRAIIEHAEYVLSQTPEMLPVLKQAGVVDSGGQGLVEVFHGAFDAFMGKEIDFRKVPVFVEASNDETMNAVEDFAEKITATVYRLDSEGRKWLHLAAVFACNFSNYCCSVAYDMLQKRGIPFSVMMPLVAETAGKLSALTPREAQTGPAARGDVKLMEEQEKLLDCDDNLAQIYRLVSQGIMRNRNKG